MIFNFKKYFCKDLKKISKEVALDIARQDYEMMGMDWQAEEIRVFENKTYWVIIIGAQQHHPKYTYSIDSDRGTIIRKRPGPDK